MAEYDPREARTLLLAALGRAAPSALARVDACRGLLEELVTLAQELGMHVESRPFVQGVPPSVIVGLPGRGLVRIREERGALRVRKESVAQPSGPGVEVPLDFDPIDQRFMGRVEDTFLAPFPGEPRPRRSPLAVLVETVIEVLESGGT